MSQVILPGPLSPQTASETPLQTLTKYGWHAIAILAWAYFILKVFVFDIDTYLISAFLPGYLSVLQYKAVMFIGLFGLAVAFFERGKVIGFLLFITFYPIIILILAIIYVFYTKNWMLLVAISNTLVSFFQSFRVNIFTFAAFVVSYALIIAFDDQEVLWPALITLVSIVYIAYIKQIFFAFRTSDLIKTYDRLLAGDFVDHIKSQTKKQLDGIDPNDIAIFNDKQLATYRNTLQTAIMMNSGRLFVANILKEYKSSGFPVLSGVLSVLILLAETILAFAAINYAAFKIDINSFNYTEFPTFFSFFHYSFFTMIFMSVKELTPATKMADILHMMQVSLMLLMTLVLASQIVSFKRQKFMDDIDSIIRKINATSDELEKYILDEFKIDSFEKALDEVRKLEYSMISLILYLSKGRE